MKQNSIGMSIKKLRCKNKLTQEEMAEKLYVTRTTISKWEREVGVPSIDILKNMSTMFNVSIDELIFGNNCKINNTMIKYNVKLLIIIIFLIFTNIICLTLFFLK